jgi:cytidine deaminase
MPRTRSSLARLRNLRAAAENARRMHYAPYSRFLVLAAVETVDGRFYGGSNVEVVNFTLTKHAEETAIIAALAAGHGPSGGWLKTVYVAGGAPCGSCRQFAYEFAVPSATWILEAVSRSQLESGPLTDLDSRPSERTMSTMLPEPFGPREVAAEGRAGERGPED